MRRRTLLATAAAAATFASMGLVAPAAASASDHTTIPHSRPSWVAHATKLAAPARTRTVTARVYLAPRGGLDAMKAAAIAAGTKGSASYHRFLSSKAFHAEYDPSSADVQAVKAYLTSQGLKVGTVAAHGRYLTATGTVAKADTAFATTIAAYKHAGKSVLAPTTALSLPSSVAAKILSVTGLSTYRPNLEPASTPKAAPPAAFANARPCSLQYGQVSAKYKADSKSSLPKFDGKTLPYAVCGYTGPQLRSAYEGRSTLTGKGVTVAILDAYAAPTIAKDANTYAVDHGDGAYTSGQLAQHQFTPFTNQTACEPSGWYGEETLDVEAVHAMAPDAKVKYYGAKSCEDQDLLDAEAAIADSNSVQIQTDSFGETESDESADLIAPTEAVFAQDALEGISVLFSSGDDGDELAASGLKQADSSASDPLVTAVGGTSTGIAPTAKSADAIVLQTGWGTERYTLAGDAKSWTAAGFQYGAGGGSSALFNQPAYQASAVTSAYRQVPDVAMDADPTTGMLVGETQTYSDGSVKYGEYRIGGTSLASPLFAGMTALAVQKAKHSAGLLNPAIYSHRSAFTDVVAAPAGSGNVRVDYVNGENAKNGLSYTVRTFGQDSSLPVTAGYDNVTGVGVPTRSWFSALG